MVNPPLCIPRVYSFQERLREGGAYLINRRLWYRFNLHKDKSTRTLNGKKRAHKVGGHEAKNKNQIHMKCYSRDKLIVLSYVYYIRIGRRGLKERGGLITFFPWKGELIREGGLIEDLWYTSFFKSTIGLIAG